MISLLRNRTIDESHISVNGKKIRIVSSRDPLSLPWKEEVCWPASEQLRRAYS